MSSSPTPYTNGHSHFLPSDEETLNPTPIFRPAAARRTPSFSSLSPSDSWDSSFGSYSSFSYNDEYPPFSPNTPLKFKGIPFSWEKIPGIPKQQSSKKKEYSGHLLPLPPAGNSNATTKKLHHQEEISPKKTHTSKLQKDPFLAALMECSKDDHDHDHHGNISKNITRSLSDRFGLINMYTSCKRTCTVTESIVYHPRSTPHYLLNRRSS